MKLGLVYVDDQAAPERPLNENVLRVCRPDFVSLTVATLPELRRRLEEVKARRVRANWILPVERLSGMAIRLMARAINDAGGDLTERVTLGAWPFDRGLRPGEFLSRVVAGVGELVHVDQVVVGLGVGPGRDARAWLLEMLAIVAATNELRPLIRGVALAVYPEHRPRRRDARRLVDDVRHFLPAAAIHVETGFRLGLELGWRDRWLEGGRQWIAAEILLRHGLRGRRVTLDAWLRDVWLATAWSHWNDVGAASVAFCGYVENASSGAWNILDDKLEASAAWRAIRLDSAIRA